jgi:hypothetical protein
MKWRKSERKYAKVPVGGTTSGGNHSRFTWFPTCFQLKAQQLAQPVVFAHE